MVTLINKSTLIIGRILLGLIFVVSGYGKIMNFEGTLGYMSAKGMPMVSLLLVGAIAVELSGGLSLILGLSPKWWALALFLFMIPTTLIFHQFWGLEAAESAMQQIHFLKNLAIMGGLLAVFSSGSSQPGLDHILCGRCCGGQMESQSTTTAE